MKNISLLLFFITLTATAATKNDPHLPISHCYHWLDEERYGRGFLTYKYQYGDKNNGDVLFKAGSNGAVAGPGLYCAKSPSGSYSYGDRVIRLDLVDDIVMYDDKTGKKHCGHDGKFYSDSECQKKPWDIKFYSGGGIGNTAWYVIKDPQAIAKWSANSDQLIADLNASKKINSGGTNTHFDQTLTAIAKERKKMGGEKVYINGNARLSIVAILDRPVLLAQIPALNVIDKIANVPNKDFSRKKKIKVYEEQFERALGDTYLSFDDYKGTLKIDQDVRNAFITALKRLDLSDLSEVNIPVTMLGYDKYLSMNKVQAISLWNQALAGNSSLAIFMTTPLDTNKILAKSFTAALAKNRSIVDNIAAHNVINMISVLEKYALQKVPGLSLPQLLESLLVKAIASSPQTVSVYKNLNNQLLEKEKALSDAIRTKYIGKFAGLDPVTIGHLVDKAQISNADKGIYSAEIAKLEIPATKEATYLLADDYEKGRVTLPSMLNKFDYMAKLYNRAIIERGQKGMTNSFRFVFSDLFHHFFTDIRKEKDDIKKDAKIKEAADFYYFLIGVMEDDQFQSYSYIALQNASFFDSRMKYDEHPVEYAFGQYATGDAKFDALFEDITKHALEGSFFQYLLENDSDPKTQKLIDIVVNYVISDDFDTWLNSPEFALSQKEKSSWKNMISNKKYTWGGKFVSSDICRFSRVLHDKRKYISKIIDKTRDDELRKVNKKLYKSKWCK